MQTKLFRLHLVLSLLSAALFICSLDAHGKCYVEPCDTIPGLDIMFQVPPCARKGTQELSSPLLPDGVQPTRAPGLAPGTQVDEHAGNAQHINIDVKPVAFSINRLPLTSATVELNLTHIFPWFRFRAWIPLCPCQHRRPQDAARARPGTARRANAPSWASAPTA